MMILIAGAVVIMSGCAADEPFSFELTFKGTYMNDKMADILIPVKENDRSYTKYNDFLYSGGSGRELPDISSGSQIVELDEDGSRSMLLHLEGSKVSFRETDEGLVQSITLPDRYGGKSGFKRFCDEFGSIRLAVFDEKGDILSISKEIPLVRHSDYYIMRRSLNFDPVENTISPEYDLTATDLIWIMIANVFWGLDIMYILVLVLVTALTGRIAPEDRKVHIIIASILNIPSIITLYILLRKEFVTHLSTNEAMAAFIENNGIIKMIGMFIPTAVLIYFCMKSYIQVKYGTLQENQGNGMDQ